MCVIVQSDRDHRNPSRRVGAVRSSLNSHLIGTGGEAVGLGFGVWKRSEYFPGLCVVRKMYRCLLSGDGRVGAM